MADMMPYMKGYTGGYKPPSGSAGSKAFGKYSHKSNPMSVPKKGSSISSLSAGYGKNPDHSKVMTMKNEQARKENLRGQPC